MSSDQRGGIGLWFINPWIRHVALTAMECGTLDELSGPRLLIGLCVSNARRTEGMLGIPFVRPIPVVLGYAAAQRALLAGEHLTREVHGAPLDAQLSFTPRPDIHVQLGVKGPVALRRAGEVADGLMLSVLSSAPYVAWVRAMHPTMRLTAYDFVSQTPSFIIQV